MTDRLKIFKMLMPAEFVLFDHNPESIKVTRAQTGGAPSRPSGGSDKPAASGAQPERSVRCSTAPTRSTITITQGPTVGPECKVMCDNLLGWMSPASGLLGGRSPRRHDGESDSTPSKPPDLIVQWGPPMAGFMVTRHDGRRRTSATCVSRRDGIPIHAVCDLTLKESPSPLSMTNPTSGGRPGRNRHVDARGRDLMSVRPPRSARPNAWRVDRRGERHRRPERPSSRVTCSTCRRPTSCASCRRRHGEVGRDELC